jgi:hypothetical protein
VHSGHPQLTFRLGAYTAMEIAPARLASVPTSNTNATGLRLVQVRVEAGKGRGKKQKK